MAEANGGDVPLVAKLERPQALEHLDEILAASDAVMVARGDLGLEMPLERVPRAQKDITRRARRQRHSGHRRHAGARVDDERGAADARRSERRRQCGGGRRRRDHAGGRNGGRRVPVARRPDARRDHPRRRVELERRRPDDAARRGPATTTRRRSARRRSRSPTAATRRRSSPSPAAAARRGGCRRCGRARRSSPTTDRDDTARRLAVYWGVVPLCTDIGENVDSAGTLDRPAARRARPGGGRRGGRVRQHQRRPDAQRRELPEDPAPLMLDVPLRDRSPPSCWRSSSPRSSSAWRTPSSIALLDALDIVGAENRAAVHARAQQLIAR